MENKSIWELTTTIEDKKILDKDIECNILIIGGGLAGILTGFLLSKDNKDIVIVEKDKIASGATKNTTAKISAQHNLIYNKLLHTIGYNKTKLFYQANIDALNKYEELIKKYNIECDYKRLNSCVYTRRNTNKLKKEYKAYLKLGIEGELTSLTELPFKIKEALFMKNQAYFNPLKFINYISKNLNIYEHTRVTKIDNDIAITDKGYKIKYNKIIIATHFPIIDVKGFFFLKQHQEKSYLLALENTNNIHGMYIDENSKNGYTIRDYNEYLIFGGYSHKTGKNVTINHYKNLEKLSENYFNNSKIITQFSAQDCMSLDKLPYIGKYSKNTNNIYVATGFNKWGMTGSMISAMIIKDLIENKPNKYNKLFNASRLNFFASFKNIIKNLINSINGLFIKRILLKRSDIINLKNDTSIIIKYKDKKLGIYKDTSGKLHAVDIRCPHLGCILSFNKEERAYECPCHGSKFDYKGNLIYSPSIHDLKKYNL